MEGGHTRHVHTAVAMRCEVSHRIEAVVDERSSVAHRRGLPDAGILQESHHLIEQHRALAGRLAAGGRFSRLFAVLVITLGNIDHRYGRMADMSQSDIQSQPVVFKKVAKAF
jgi:hypothetical protein